jgi:maltose-binding protein MalE
MEATSYGQKLPDHARLSEILDTVQAELDLAVLGDKSVEQAMTDACTAIDSLLAE